MPAPFKTPTFISDRNFLVAADYELIARLVDANYDELIYIVKAINAHQRLLDCVKELRDYVKSATLEGDEPPTAEADALIEELNS